MSTRHAAHRKLLYIALGIMILAALAVRIAPLIEGGDRLQRQCVSEDGYLMLTIARNFALGRGFSVSDGEIPSNGTQPLMALIYAACYLPVDGDRVAALYPIVGLQVLLSMITAVLLFLFVRRYLYRGPHADIVALLAASLWFASPSSVMHSQNTLETGFCALLILCSMTLYDRLRDLLLAKFALPACLGLGALLGVTFLGRNDVCLLIAVMLLVHLWRGHRHGNLSRAFGQSLVIGATSVLVSTPWLYFNLTRFGHIVPISGRAEAFNVEIASNLPVAFGTLLENSIPFMRIPYRLIDTTAMAVCAALILAAGLLVAWRCRHWLASHFSPGVGILAGFVGALFVYYALFFGMPSFLGRYFFPQVMLSSMLAAALTVHLWVRVPRPSLRPLIVGLGVPAILVCMALNGRIYLRGKDHMHFQVVDWVRDNVPADVWAGAVQTGTLGYYNDRTINLDGKVNPEAFTARKKNRIAEYAVERNVAYIADWVGVAQWIERPEFAANYELLLRDEALNLAVLRLKSARPPA